VETPALSPPFEALEAVLDQLDVDEQQDPEQSQLERKFRADRNLMPRHINCPDIFVPVADTSKG
jgi:hypothetical protein